MKSKKLARRDSGPRQKRTDCFPPLEQLGRSRDVYIDDFTEHFRWGQYNRREADETRSHMRVHFHTQRVLARLSMLRPCMHSAHLRLPLLGEV